VNAALTHRVGAAFVRPARVTARPGIPARLEDFRGFPARGVPAADYPATLLRSLRGTDAPRGT